MKYTKGFTLVEMLVVITIILIMTGLLIGKFAQSRVDLNQWRLQVMDGIREAQSLALASAKFNDTYRCGYGVHFESNGFSIYAGPDASTLDCSSDALHQREYNASTDEIVRAVVFSNAQVEVIQVEGAPPAPDIFFQPPDPTTYICLNSPAVACGSADQQAGISIDIGIGLVGALCPSDDCRIIHATTSGLITIQ